MIDEKTGLVKVPDDMYWEVVKVNHDNYSGALYRLLLNRVRTHTDKVLVKRGWSKREYVDQHRITAQAVSSYDLFEEVFGRVPEGEGWIDFSSEYTTHLPGHASHTVVNRRFLRSEKVTGAKVARASEITWARYLGGCQEVALKLDAEMEQNKLVGVYPPKSVKGEYGS